MKATEFIDLMRKAVREEVRSIIKEELKPLKLMIEGKRTNTSTKPAASRKQLSEALPKKKVSVPPHIKGINGPLADILAETYMAMQQEEPYNDPEAEWPDMQETFTSNHVPPSFITQPTTQNQSESSINNNTTQPLMRDYSSLLKRADEIANNSRG